MGRPSVLPEALGCYMHLFLLCFSGFRGGRTASPTSQPLECLSQPYSTDNAYPWHGGTMPPWHSRSTVFPTSALLLKQLMLPPYLRNGFLGPSILSLCSSYVPPACLAFPCPQIHPSPALGLPLPQGPLFPEKALGFSSCFLPSWVSSSPSLRLRRSRERILMPSLSFLQSWFAHPSSVGLDCALAPSPGSYPIFLWLTLPDLIPQSGVTMVGFPSSPSQGHGGGLATGAVLPMALWPEALLKTPVRCLILVLVVKMGWLRMWDLQVGLIVGGRYGI